jgi:replicative DNA helicase
MPLHQSAARWVQRISQYSGAKLREGRVTQDDFQRLLRDWAERQHLPLIFNFASNMRQSQIRTLVAEAIRKYNVGFVVIDHFRMFDTDRRFQNSNQEDENKVRFLKESLALDLNVAVLCLAHTVKVGRDSEGRSPRPKLSDLRGSGQVAAHSDFVGFLYRPTPPGEEAASLMGADITAMELYWEKNRFGSQQPQLLTFDPVTMHVADRLKA